MNPKINRSSIADAKMVFEKLIPNPEIREKVIQFLAAAIQYADSLNSENWNLNLDKDGTFIQFNVGHEYCIRFPYIESNHIFVVGDRTVLKPIFEKKQLPLTLRFVGFSSGRKMLQEIDFVPDALKKTPNSIGCLLAYADVVTHIDTLQSATFDFIAQANRLTKINSKMTKAHSTGAISYIQTVVASFMTSKKEEKIYTISEIIEAEQRAISMIRKQNPAKILQRIKNSNPIPTMSFTKLKVFNRNRDIVAYVLNRANGICERCKMNGPFIKDVDNTPYLEVHHIKSLAEGGEDSIENTIALCPNCHRHAHLGKKTY